MTVQRSSHLGGVGGVALQHLVVGDQTLGALGQEHLVTELHRLAHFASLDQIGVRFEDRVHFLFGANLLSLDDSPPGLIDYPIPQLAVPRNLPADLVDDQTAGHVDALDLAGLVDDPARVFQHLLGDAK